MKCIGITGPTGAGKTTALTALATLGVHAIDCDQVYHRLLLESPTLAGVLTERFGSSILVNSQIDRKRLGTIIFGNPKLLEELSAITHCFIRDEVARQRNEAVLQGTHGIAIDAIALIESGLGADCDAVVGVLAPTPLRIARIMAREGISEEYACKRVAAQKGDNFFRANCDYILENSEADTVATFRGKALALFTNILNQPVGGI